MSMILLLTVGGTPLVAMQKYAPICSRFTLVMLNTGPSMLGTETHILIAIYETCAAMYEASVKNKRRQMYFEKLLI